MCEGEGKEKGNGGGRSRKRRRDQDTTDRAKQPRWTSEEDNQLIEAVENAGPDLRWATKDEDRWAEIDIQLGTSRTPVSLRTRYLQTLRPNTTANDIGPFVPTQEEATVLSKIGWPNLRLHKKSGGTGYKGVTMKRNRTSSGSRSSQQYFQAIATRPGSRRVQIGTYKDKITAAAAYALYAETNTKLTVDANGYPTDREAALTSESLGVAGTSNGLKLYLSTESGTGYCGVRKDVEQYGTQRPFRAMYRNKSLGTFATAIEAVQKCTRAPATRAISASRSKWRARRSIFYTKASAAQACRTTAKPSATGGMCTARPSTSA